MGNISTLRAARCTRFPPKHWVLREVSRPGYKSEQASDPQGGTTSQYDASISVTWSSKPTATKASFMAKSLGQSFVVHYALTAHFRHVFQEDCMCQPRDDISECIRVHSLLNLTTLSRDEPDSSRTFFRLPSDSIWSQLCTYCSITWLTVAALISPIPTCPLQKTSPGTLTAGLLWGFRGNSELLMISLDIVDWAR